MDAIRTEEKGELAQEKGGSCLPGGASDLNSPCEKTSATSSPCVHAVDTELRTGLHEKLPRIAVLAISSRYRASRPAYCTTKVTRSILIETVSRDGSQGPRDRVWFNETAKKNPMRRSASPNNAKEERSGIECGKRSTHCAACGKSEQCVSVRGVSGGMRAARG